MIDHPRSRKWKKNETTGTMRQVLNDLDAGNLPNPMKEQQKMIDTERNRRDRKNEGLKQVPCASAAV